MHIDVHKIEKNDETCIFGLNIEPNYKRVCINLFNLEENRQGSQIEDNFWGIKNYVLNEVNFGKVDKDNLDWSLSTGPFTSELNFIEMNQQSVQLELGNKWVLECMPYTLEKYKQDYKLVSGRPMHKSEWEEDQNEGIKETPITAYAVPCDEARDGVFYCKPAFFYSNVHHNYDYVMVDTAKLFELMEHDTPQQADHAFYQAKNDRSEEWVKWNSFKNSCDTGSFAFVTGTHHENDLIGKPSIVMQTGDAAVLIMAQELALPFLPIAIMKGNFDFADQAKVNDIIQNITYSPEIP